MQKAELENFLTRKGWTKDRFGHYQKEVNGRKVRFKLQANSARYERQIHIPADRYSPARNEWIRVSSGYYKDLTITAEDKLAGLKR